MIKENRRHSQCFRYYLVTVAVTIQSRKIRELYNQAGEEGILDIKKINTYKR